MINKIKKQPTWLIYSIILFLITSVLHFAFAFNHVPFSQDQGRDLYLISQAIETGNYLIPYGPKTSVGDFTTFPFYYQLMVFAHLLVNKPLTMYFVVTLIESFTPVFLYLLLRLFVKNKAAFFSAFLYSTFFLVLQYSTNTWSPNLIPFLTTLGLFAWMTFIIKDKPWYLVLGTIALGLNLHLHFQTVLLVPFALMVFIISLRRNFANLKYWLLGALAVLISFSPYLFSEAQTNWPNTKAIIAFYTVEHSQYFDQVSKPAYIFTFFPKFMEKVMFGANLKYFVVGRTLFFTGMLLLSLKALRGEKYRWLLLYFLTIFLSIRLFKGDKHDYYLMVLFSMPAVLFSLLIERLNKLSLPMLLTFSVVMGWVYLQPNFNQLNVLKSEIELISQNLPQNEPVHIVFHDLDMANAYLYGFATFSNIDLDRDADTIIDMCKRRTRCWNTEYPMCKYSSSYVYSTELKLLNNYQSQQRLKASQEQYVEIGELDSIQKKHPVFASEMFERKDLINTEIN